MPNSFPYFMLIAVSAVLFGFSWFKAGTKKLIPYYLTMAGLVYLFEYVVLVLLNSSIYVPRVFQDRYFDNIFGANVSDGFIIPSTTVLLAVFRLNYRWALFFSLVFMGVEQWFLHLGIYRHHWWTTLYTGGSLLVNYAIGQRLWKAVRRGRNSFLLRLFVLWFACATIQATVIFYLVALFHLLIFRVAWFDDASRNHIALATLYVYANSFFLALSAAVRAGWRWNAGLLAGIACVDVQLGKAGLLEIYGAWVIGLLAVFEAAILYALIRMRGFLPP